MQAEQPEHDAHSKNVKSSTVKRVQQKLRDWNTQLTDLN